MIVVSRGMIVEAVCAFASVKDFLFLRFCLSAASSYQDRSGGFREEKPK